MTEPLVFLSGNLVPSSQAKINIYDLGIVLGATFTDLARTFRHRPFRLEDHIDRLLRSLKYGGIASPFSRQELIEISQKLAHENSKLITETQDLAIVYFVTPGENPVYAGSAGGSVSTRPTFCIHTFPLPFSLWRPAFVDGVHVVTPSIRHVPPECVDPKTKNRSRLHWFLADQQARLADPRAIALLLDLSGNITETSGSNFVSVTGRTIYTPRPRNILHGVSLDTVAQLAPKAGLELVERDIQVYDVVNADEAWLTTTPYCIAPVSRINGTPIGDGRPGPLWRRMLELWSDEVGLDVHEQVMTSAL
jgi:branched-subunit amino acid aminotransferase/4-amino-4-deoxychorismate lyase